MKPDYKNGVPKGMIGSCAAGLAAALLVVWFSLFVLTEGMLRSVLLTVSAAAVALLLELSGSMLLVGIK